MGSSESRIEDDTAMAVAPTATPGLSSPPGLAHDAACGAVGLQNFGNSCYLNAVVQLLFCCRPLRRRCAVLYRKALDPDAHDAEEVDAEDADDDAGPGEAASRSPVSNAEDQRHGHDAHGHAGQSYRSEADATNFSAASTATAADGVSPDARPQAAAAAAPKEPARGGTKREPVPVVPETSVLFRLCELFALLGARRAKKGYVQPASFVKTVKEANEMFRNNLQQDAHEFLQFVLNAIIDEERAAMGLSPVDNTTPSPIKTLFAGTSVVQTFCMDCDTMTSTTQPFLDIYWEVEPNASLRHCAESSSSVEFLTGDNRFRCDACTSICEARRRMAIQQAPPILLVQLKRFKMIDGMGTFSKANERVPFPTVLTLPAPPTGAGLQRKGGPGASPAPPQRYVLSGVVVHQGTSPHLGHYICLGRRLPVGSQWRKCDDEMVTSMPERDLAKYFGTTTAMHDGMAQPATTAYLLMYTALSEATRVAAGKA